MESRPIKCSSVGHNQDARWPEHASITYPRKGDVKLTEQHPRLQEVIRGIMAHLIGNILFENAYPSYTSRPAFVFSSMKVVTDQLDTSWAADIQKHAEYDSTFVEDLTDLPMTRLTLLRKGVKERATNVVGGHYGIAGKDADAIKQLVASLKVNDRYVFATKPN
ncbi:hypothetical protein H0H92_014528, partial [Tricholoma furcatifolium]